MIYFFFYVGGIGIWRLNFFIIEVELIEVYGAVYGLAKLRVFLVLDLRSFVSYFYLFRFRWVFFGSEGFIQVWIVRFQDNEADVVTLDVGLVFEVGFFFYNLKFVVVEFYGFKIGKFFLGIQEGVCGFCFFLVDVEFCFVQVGNGDQIVRNIFYWGESRE